MRIEYDDAKRQWTLENRDLDFEDAGKVFDGAEYTWADDRPFDYGEVRYNTFGNLDGRLVALTWTIRGGNRRIISMRKANEREQTFYKRTMD